LLPVNTRCFQIEWFGLRGPGLFPQQVSLVPDRVCQSLRRPDLPIQRRCACVVVLRGWKVSNITLSLRQADEESRGGMTFRAFDIVYPGSRLLLTTYTYPDGKLEQYIVAPEQ